MTRSELSLGLLQQEVHRDAPGAYRPAAEVTGAAQSH